MKRSLELIFMESENENRPLLHDFENETWRSRTRKRCTRIPSEAAITGLILGVFFVVVTLLIVLENMEKTEKEDISINKKLLASPGFNQKLADKSWQDEKLRKLDNINNDWKIKPDQSDSPKYDKKQKVKSWKDEKQRKFDKVNKGWKILPNVTGRSEMDYNKFINSKYAKEQKNINDAWKDKMNVLQSPKATAKKNAREDDGWEKLFEQGWKNKEIEGALLDAWKNKDEKENQPMSASTFQSLLEKAREFIVNIKDEKDKTGTKSTNNMLSPSSFKELKSLMEASKNEKYGKKNPDNNEKAEKDSSLNLVFDDFIDFIMKKIKEQEKNDTNGNTDKEDDGSTYFMYSSSNSDDFHRKDYEKVKKDMMNKQRSVMDEAQKRINGKKSKKTSGQNDYWENSIEQISEDMMNKRDQWERKMNESRKKTSGQKGIKDFWNSPREQDKMDENTNKVDDGSTYLMHSPLNIDDFFQNLITENREDHLKVNKDMMNKQKSINDAWRKKMNDIEQGRNSISGKNDGSETETGDNEQKILMSSMKWKNVDNGYKKLSTNGWNAKDMKDAVNKASGDGEQILKTAMGDYNMKWKKVNDGYKKTYNKSLGDFASCPLSRVHKSLYLLSSTPSSPIDCALIAEEVKRKFGECIDVSFLSRRCKPSWRAKCFTTYKYRKIDGTCNNRIHPTWGQSSIPFVRMIAPVYEDGVSEIRNAEGGGELPNARYVSRKLYSVKRRSDGDTTTLFLYFGLLVDHDMIQTALNSNGISCCDIEMEANDTSVPKECLQIDIPSDDPFYGPKNVTCLNLVRSFPVNGECAGRREQMNQATSYLDGSAVYGSNYEHAKRLRTFRRGQLRTQMINNTPFMSNTDGPSTCGNESEPLKCFDAGDSRVNMLVELTAMHAVWYREHNRIATELHKINPKWTDEILYQEARRIVAAEIQHITYNEFLPLLLGKKAVEKYNLKIDKSSVYDMYDDTVDASVFNVIGAAAFRFGHSLVPDSQYIIGAKNSTFGEIPLHKTFFTANLLYHNGLDLLLRGAATQRTHRADSYITPEIREHLFQPSNLDYGFDLAAVGIQRGRDHGLPPYVQWRKACRLSEIKHWDDLYDIVDAEEAELFKKVYRSVEDIDLIAGSLSERHKDGSLLGPTHTCLLGRQFKKTRLGDRFWFEIQNEIGSFTKDQLEEIYKSNMARIICDNSDSIDEIQKNPFKIPSNDNPHFDCSKIERVDLSKWAYNY